LEIVARDVDRRGFPLLNEQRVPIDYSACIVDRSGIVTGNGGSA